MLVCSTARGCPSAAQSTLKTGRPRAPASIAFAASFRSICRSACSWWSSEAPDGTGNGDSDRLIVGAHLGMGPQHAVDGAEHIAHALFGNRALDDDDQFGFVRGGTHQPPRAVFDRHAHAVDGRKLANRLPGDFLSILPRRFEMSPDRIDDRIFLFIVAMRCHRWRAPGSRQRLAQIGHALVRIAIEHVADREGEDHAVVISAAEGLVEEEMSRFLETGKCAEFVDAALDIGMTGLPVVDLDLVRLQYGIGEKESR